MRKITALFLFISFTVFFAVSATADVGVTDRCQEEVRELEDKMRDNKDDYTIEARSKSQAKLAAAKTNRANPAKCRENLRDARQELRDGKN
jgi:hypothetical protein